jgi:hypothetical protein
MKWTSAVAFLTVLAIATATSAFAQQQVIQGKIPFNFTVGEVVLPAGEYEVVSLGDQVIKIRTADGRNWAVIMGLQSHHDAFGGSRLEFDRIGDSYFLRRVLSRSVTSLNSDFAMSGSERTVRERQTSLRSNARVLIAMK